MNLDFSFGDFLNGCLCFIFVLPIAMLIANKELRRGPIADLLERWKENLTIAQVWVGILWTLAIIAFLLMLGKFSSLAVVIVVLSAIVLHIFGRVVYRNFKAEFDEKENTEESDKAPPMVDVAKMRRNTNFGVGIGVLLQVGGLFIAQLGMNGLSAAAAIILGLVLILVSIPIFTWGCMNYAEAKGYSKEVGLFGLLGLIGLIVLPDKVRDGPEAREHRPVKGYVGDPVDKEENDSNKTEK